MLLKLKRRIYQNGDYEEMIWCWKKLIKVNAWTTLCLLWPHKRDFIDTYRGTGKRKRREKEGKGLRHFSMKVCEKVQAKQVTSYNEVADELVREFTAPHQQSPISPSEQVTTIDWFNSYINHWYQSILINNWSINWKLCGLYSVTLLVDLV